MTYTPTVLYSDKLINKHELFTRFCEVLLDNTTVCSITKLSCFRVTKESNEYSLGQCMRFIFQLCNLPIYNNCENACTFTNFKVVGSLKS